jgi:forespore regulator of the sigma-K checkpoint
VQFQKEGVMMPGWVRRLRERLRKKKPALLLASTLCLVGVAGIVSWNGSWKSKSWNIEHRAATGDKNSAQQTIAPQNIEIIIQRNYRLGPVVEEKQYIPATNRDDIMEKFSGMELLEEKAGRFVFKTFIDDISPLINNHLFFGLSDDGFLSIYEGSLEEDNVIQTFFQLDIKRMESSLPLEEVKLLKKGIPFSSMSEYNSILSTYGEFAIMAHDEETHEY